MVTTTFTVERAAMTQQQRFTRQHDENRAETGRSDSAVPQFVRRRSELSPAPAPDPAPAPTAVSQADGDA